MPPNVQTFWTKPGATVILLLGDDEVDVVDLALGSRFGAFASIQDPCSGAFGSAATSALGSGPPWSSGAAVAPAPIEHGPVIPAAAWPGIAQMNVSPPSGITT